MPCRAVGFVVRVPPRPPICLCVSFGIGGAVRLVSHSRTRLATGSHLLNSCCYASRVVALRAGLERSAIGPSPPRPPPAILWVLVPPEAERSSNAQTETRHPSRVKPESTERIVLSWCARTLANRDERVLKLVEDGQQAPSSGGRHRCVFLGNLAVGTKKGCS